MPSVKICQHFGHLLAGILSLEYEYVMNQLTLGVGIRDDIDLARETDSFSFSAAICFRKANMDLLYHIIFNPIQTL